ncbi:YndJ family protein [Actinomadura barringtoniae]|uniref:YndJ family protein n=1 Tax=Actinomadura barringtoniae TaxID=1427535 RepID=A0A939PDU0_9ACTN|nr:YndJ family protein [Actinomadura barringtoniae]MBO2446656.1 YndJ family protein [Actinomadura barringtoniae]
MTALVNVIVMTGMLAVVPLGLALIGLPAWTRHLWLAGAVAGVTSLWLPRGSVAVTLAVIYALATLPLAACGAAVVLKAVIHRTPFAFRGLTWAIENQSGGGVAVGVALGMPVMAATALVAERGGVRLFGFSLRVLSLTVAHFHFAGFAAALTAGLVCRASGGKAAGVAAWSVPVGTLVVLVGYFTGEWVEFAGAVVLTCGMWLVGWVIVNDVRAGGVARGLLLVSAGVLAVTMVLALWWALGEASGVVHPSLGWMAATHGVGNAFGFGLCGMLAWRMVRKGELDG